MFSSRDKYQRETKLLESIKYLLLLKLIIVVVTIGHAQQLPIFTQYSEYGGLINPSHIHFDNYHFGQNVSIGAAYRDQWTQIPDRPKTFIARYERSTTRRRGVNMTFGGFLLSDVIGVFRTTELKGRVAGFFKTRSRGKEFSGFALGLNFGISQYIADLSQIAYLDVDPLLFRERSAELYPDVGVGISYINEFRNSDYLQVGLSVPQIFSLDHTYTNDRKRFDITQVPHFYLTSSYYKMLTDETYLEFTSWVKRVKNIPLNFDLLCRYRFSENMWIGAGANSAGLIHTEVGLIFRTDSSNQIKVSYAFNPTFQTHSVIFGNIHELNLSYTFKSSKR